MRAREDGKITKRGERKGKEEEGENKMKKM